MVLYQLWERRHYCIAQERYDELYQANLPNNSAAEARSLAVAQYIQETTEKLETDYSDCGKPGTIRNAVNHILRRASRWTALINSVKSREILLIDQNQHVMRPETIIGNVIEQGTDAEFDEMVDFLLDPKNLVKDNCLRLSGVSEMISDLADAQDGSELREYLARQVKRRVQDVFGDVAVAPTEKLKVVEGPSQLDILAIFGIAPTFKHSEESKREWRGNGDSRARELEQTHHAISGRNPFR